MRADDIYLDYNATTPCDPRVIECMLPYLGQIYGNPANGLHRQGRLAAQAVERAREQVAALIAAEPHEIVFTAGTTESNNMAILGVARASHGDSRTRIVTTAIEHKAVLLPCQSLEQEGFEVIVLPVDEAGRTSVEDAARVIDNRTLLVSMQAANNEIGTIQPIQEVSHIAAQHGALVHCDAAQAVGKILVNVKEWGVDLLSISAHKLYGPKGVGALYLDGGVQKMPIAPIILGGGHERGLRAGTLNVPAIVGFGEACRTCQELLPTEMDRIRTLRDLFEARLVSELPEVKINAQDVARLPNTSSLVFPHVEADVLVLNMPNVMVGTSAACSTGTITPSHVLQAIGRSYQDAFSTIRASLGRFTTQEDVLTAVSSIAKAYKDVMSGLASQ